MFQGLGHGCIFWSHYQAATIYLNSDPVVLQCGPWTSSISIIWKFLRNANS